MGSVGQRVGLGFWLLVQNQVAPCPTAPTPCLTATTLPHRTHPDPAPLAPRSAAATPAPARRRWEALDGRAATGAVLCSTTCTSLTGWMRLYANIARGTVTLLPGRTPGNDSMTCCGRSSAAFQRGRRGRSLSSATNGMNRDSCGAEPRREFRRRATKGVPAQSHYGLCGPLQVAGGLQPLLRPRAARVPGGHAIRASCSYY